MKRAAALILSAFALSACAELGLPDLLGELTGGNEPKNQHEYAKQRMAKIDPSATELPPLSFNLPPDGKATFNLNLQAGKVYSFFPGIEPNQECGLSNLGITNLRNVATRKVIAGTRYSNEIAYQPTQTGRYILTVHVDKDPFGSCRGAVYMFEGSKVGLHSFF